MNKRREIGIWCVLTLIFASAHATPTDSTFNHKQKDSLLTTIQHHMVPGGNTPVSNPRRTAGSGNSWVNSLSLSIGQGWGTGGSGNTVTPQMPPVKQQPTITAPPRTGNLPPAMTDTATRCTYQYLYEPGDTMYVVRIYASNRDTFAVPAGRMDDASTVLQGMPCDKTLPRDLFSLPEEVIKSLLCARVPHPRFDVAPTYDNFVHKGSKYTFKADCSFCDSIVWMRGETVVKSTQLNVYRFTLTHGYMPLRDYNMLPGVIPQRGPIDTNLTIDPVTLEDANWYQATIFNKCHQAWSNWVYLSVFDSTRTFAAKTTLANKPEEEVLLLHSVYPNPMQEEVNITAAGKLEARLYNPEGKLLMRERGADMLKMNTAHLPAGVYVVQVISALGEDKRMLVK